LTSTDTNQISFDDCSEVGMPDRVFAFTASRLASSDFLTPSLVIYTKKVTIVKFPNIYATRYVFVALMLQF
jgi:hypothetical protein